MQGRVTLFFREGGKIASCSLKGNSLLISFGCVCVHACKELPSYIDEQYVDIAFEVESKLIQPAFIFHLAVWFMLLQVTLVPLCFWVCYNPCTQVFYIYIQYKLLILSAEISICTLIYTNVRKCTHE